MLQASGTVFDATFALDRNSKYKVMADVKLKGLGTKSTWTKNFLTSNCREL